MKNEDKELELLLLEEVDGVNFFPLDPEFDVCFQGVEELKLD